jgi:hypothetical protein
MRFRRLFAAGKNVVHSIRRLIDADRIEMNGVAAVRNAVSFRRLGERVCVSLMVEDHEGFFMAALTVG